jgi:hydroxymethylglutaryl-CoA reductase (NADPH)
MFVPKAILKALYTNGSLANTDEGFRFELKNRLLDAKLVGVRRVAVDGRDVPLDGAHLVTGDGRVVRSDEVSAAAPLDFELGDTFDVRLRAAPLAPGTHALEIEFEAQPVGTLTLAVEDGVAA